MGRSEKKLFHLSFLFFHRVFSLLSGCFFIFNAAAVCLAVVCRKLGEVLTAVFPHFIQIYIELWFFYGSFFLSPHFPISTLEYTKTHRTTIAQLTAVKCWCFIFIICRSLEWDFCLHKTRTPLKTIWFAIKKKCALFENGLFAVAGLWVILLGFDGCANC